MYTSFIPARESELVTWSANFDTLINATPTVYGLTAPQATAYQLLNANYASAYQTASDPSTRTPTAIVAKNMAKDELIASARELAGIIQKHPGTTDVMRSDLGLTVPAAEPTPIPAPSVSPGMDLVSVVGRTVTVHIHDSASSSKRGKPAGAVAAWVYSFVGENYPSDPAAWKFEGATTRSKHEVVFDSAVAGGTQVWVCAAWINAKQESGPPSTPITTNLQGGGASSAEAMKIAA